ncbi:hypothetical protein NL676_039452 [Syzygium grande]|nr:hypothetical protein NL676_039452 [Syzygium grande]
MELVCAGTEAPWHGGSVVRRDSIRSLRETRAFIPEILHSMYSLSSTQYRSARRARKRASGSSSSLSFDGFPAASV